MGRTWREAVRQEMRVAMRDAMRDAERGSAGKGRRWGLRGAPGGTPSQGEGDANPPQWLRLRAAPRNWVVPGTSLMGPLRRSASR